MIVLSIWGSIEPIILSKKLGIYISNFYESEHEDWIPHLEEQLVIGKQILELTSEKSSDEINENVAALYGISPSLTNDWARQIVKKMIF